MEPIRTCDHHWTNQITEYSSQVTRIGPIRRQNILVTWSLLNQSEQRLFLAHDHCYTNQNIEFSGHGTNFEPIRPIRSIWVWDHYWTNTNTEYSGHVSTIWPIRRQNILVTWSLLDQWEHWIFWFHDQYWIN